MKKIFILSLLLNLTSFGQYLPLETIVRDPSQTLEAINGDFDGNGVQDLLVFNPLFGIEIYFNGDMNNIVYHYLNEIPNGSNSFHSADVNGDGFDELFFYSSPGTLFKVDNNNGILNNSITPVGAWFGIIQITDFDQNGIEDLFVWKTATRKSILFFDSNGDLDFELELDVNFSPQHKTYLADFENDGDLDVFGFNNNEISYFENLGGNNWNVQTTNTSWFSTFSEAFIIDIDEDGIEDLITANNNKLYKINQNSIVYTSFPPQTVSSYILAPYQTSASNNAIAAPGFHGIIKHDFDTITNSFFQIDTIQTDNNNNLSYTRDLDGDGLRNDILSHYYNYWSICYSNTYNWIQSIKQSTITHDYPIIFNNELFYVGKYNLGYSGTPYSTRQIIYQTKPNNTIDLKHDFQIVDSLSAVNEIVSQNYLIRNDTLLIFSTKQDSIICSYFDTGFNLIDSYGKDGPTYITPPQGYAEKFMCNIQDFTGNNFPDLAFIGADTIVTYENSGNSFSFKQNLATDIRVNQNVQFGNFGGDSKLDIIQAGYRRLINVNGIFSPTDSMEGIPPGEIHTIHYYDLDYDGYSDAIYVDDINYDFHIEKSDGNEFIDSTIMQWSLYYAQPAFVWDVTDFDFDGDLDILYKKFGSDAQIFLQFNNSGTLSMFNDFYLDLVGSNGNNGTFKHFDINFDGINDLLVYTSDPQAPFQTGIRQNIFSSTTQIPIQAFYDLDSNGIMTSDEIGFNQASFSASPSPTQLFSYSNGLSILYYDSSLTYQITPNFNTSYFDLTTDSTTYTYDPTTNNTDTIFYGFKVNQFYDSSVIDLVAINHTCAQNNQVFVKYQEFSSMYSSGYIEIEIDPQFTLNTFTTSVDSSINNRYYISFDSLLYGEEFLFSFLGTNPPSISLPTVFYSARVYIEDSPGVFSLRDTLQIGEVITCAYDPNIKEVIPLGEGANGYISDTINYLDYTVTFQNTGTDTAFNVVIKDQIDPNFHLDSITILSSSDTMHYTLQGDEYSFVFPNINLPDSSVDFLGSMGFVKFRLFLNDKSPGTGYNNYADIYFDFNPPITTNTTHNEIPNCNLSNKADHFLISNSNFCLGDIVDLNVDTTGNYNYLLIYQNDTITGDTFVVNNDQFYRFVFSENGCSGDSVYNISVTTPTGVSLSITSQDTMICSQSVTVISNNPGYWIDSQGFVLQLNDSALVSTSGWTYIVSDTICEYEKDSIELFNFNYSNSNILTTNDTICSGSSEIISNDLDYNVYYYVNDSLIAYDDSINATIGGSYSYIDSTICGTYTDTIEIIGLNSDTLEIIYSDTNFCFGDSLYLNSNYPNESIWNFEGSFFAMPTGNYIDSSVSISLNSGNICLTNSDTIYFIEFTYYSPMIWRTSDSLFSENGFISYTWYLDGSFNTNEEDFYIISNGIYYLEVVDSNGCIHISDTININDLSTQEFESDEIVLYPNPTTGRINLDIGSIQPQHNVIIRTIEGKVVSEFKFQKPNNQFEIIGVSGTYLIEVRTINGTLVKKVIKK